MIRKRALSNLVAYVLLITITISLSVMIYGWLKFYVDGEDIPTCPEGVNIIVESYSCSGNSLTVNLRNKGFFSIEGFVLRTHNRSNAEFGVHVLNSTGVALAPGANTSRVYSFVGDPITIVDVQPFLDREGDKISCESYASQKVVCS
jgi:hypothetical protein